jgi:hypothetical protein
LAQPDSFEVADADGCSSTTANPMQSKLDWGGGEPQYLLLLGINFDVVIGVAVELADGSSKMWLWSKI